MSRARAHTNPGTSDVDDASGGVSGFRDYTEACHACWTVLTSAWGQFALVTICERGPGTRVVLESEMLQSTVQVRTAGVLKEEQFTRLEKQDTRRQRRRILGMLSRSRRFSQFPNISTDARGVVSLRRAGNLAVCSSTPGCFECNACHTTLTHLAAAFESDEGKTVLVTKGKTSTTSPLLSAAT